jgi:hypothetical protein
MGRFGTFNIDLKQFCSKHIQAQLQTHLMESVRSLWAEEVGIRNAIVSSQPLWRINQLLRILFSTPKPTDQSAKRQPIASLRWSDWVTQLPGLQKSKHAIWNPKLTEPKPSPFRYPHQISSLPQARTRTPPQNLEARGKAPKGYRIGGRVRPRHSLAPTIRGLHAVDTYNCALLQSIRNAPCQSGIQRRRTETVWWIQLWWE